MNSLYPPKITMGGQTGMENDLTLGGEGLMQYSDDVS